MKKRYRSDYPKKPIGDGNPYNICARCYRSDPEIRGEIEGHEEWCEWRKHVELEEAYATLRTKYAELEKSHKDLKTEFNTIRELAISTNLRLEEQAMTLRNLREAVKQEREAAGNLAFARENDALHLVVELEKVYKDRYKATSSLVAD